METAGVQGRPTQHIHYDVDVLELKLLKKLPMQEEQSDLSICPP